MKIKHHGHMKIKPIPQIPGFSISESGIVYRLSEDGKTVIEYPTYKVRDKYNVFCYRGKVIYIHRLVYSIFVNPKYKGQITMIDGNYNNLHYNNLRAGVIRPRRKYDEKAAFNAGMSGKWASFDEWKTSTC